MTIATEEHRDALAHLIAIGGTVNMSRLVPLLDVAGASVRLCGVPVRDLFDRGLVMITDYGHSITITSMGRALAKAKP